MKRMVLLILLLALIVSSAFAQTASVTACEWFTGADPGVGSGNSISFGTPNDTVSLAFAVATNSFLPGITRVKIRCRADSVRSSLSGVWGVPTDGFAMVSQSTGTVRLVTQFEYRVDNGTWTLVNPADATQININESVSTAGLSFGLHRLDIRLTDDLNRLGPATNNYFFVFDPTTSQARLVTQVQYWFDSDAPTTLDVADAATVNVNEIIATASLSVGLHRFNMRAIDDLGRIGPVTNVSLIVTSPFGPGAPHNVVQVQYWFDSDAPTTIDVTDAPVVNVNELIATAGLSVGLHRFNMRAIDDGGRIGATTNGSLIVISPFGPGVQRTITAAEYYINVDPGAGNGVAIPLPDDGAYDEGEESVTQVLTGLPIGLHLVGIRVQDNAGRWSRAITDSLIVGPVLVIRSSGNNIVLNWSSGSGVDQFKIYRAATANGSYALLDSTTAQTYSDVNAIPGAAQRFYYVTFETTTLSPFRMPGATPPRE